MKCKDCDYYEQFAGGVVDGDIETIHICTSEEECPYEGGEK